MTRAHERPLLLVSLAFLTSGLTSLVLQVVWFKSLALLLGSTLYAMSTVVAVFLAGLTQGNAKRLVEDLRAALGRTIPLIAPDSFASDRVAAELGPAGEAIYATEAGIEWRQLPGAATRFLRALGRPSVGVQQSYALEAAQATEILLDGKPSARRGRIPSMISLSRSIRTTGDPQPRAASASSIRAKIWSASASRLQGPTSPQIAAISFARPAY